MATITGHFRTTGIRILDLGSMQWRIELWNWNTGVTEAAKECSAADPKKEAVIFIASVFREEERAVRPDIQWNDL